VLDEEIAGWQELFLAFHARFAPLFYRAEVRERSLAYLQALLDRVERKNGWQLAEAMGDADPDGAQRLLYAAVWDADAVRDELQRFVAEAFGRPDGILVVDESGVPKKGEKSVGVKKQYCGALGKVENCQVGVFLTYTSSLGHAFLDRRLFLPEEWANDSERRREAKVPEAVTFATKPQLAQAMLTHAFALGIPAAWVTGDEGYGGVPALRTSLEQRPCAYVLAVRSNEPLTVPHGRAAGVGAPKPRLVGLLETAAGTAAKLLTDAWERHSAGAGSKGERWYDWALRPLAEQAPAGWRKWLLVRRRLDDGELAYYRVFAPEDTALATLVHVAGSRWTIEQCLEEAKGEAGLDQYEVRHWHSWHRQITLSLLAHAFLAWLRLRAHTDDLSTGGGGENQRQYARPGRRPPRAGGGQRAGSAPPLGAGPAVAPAQPPTPPQLVTLATTSPSPCPALPLPTPPTPPTPLTSPSLICGCSTRPIRR
jgi:SRSO17 transposase